MNLAPLNFTKISVGLYRNTGAPPIAPATQGELLRELHRDYPSLTQIPSGVLFADPAKGRALLIDQTRVEASENSLHVPSSAIEAMQSDLQRTVPIVDYAPPYRVRVEGAGTIQALEGVDPAEVLRTCAPPDPGWNEIGGKCTHVCVRFLFTSAEGIQRDAHVEPLFAQQDKFYVMIVSFMAAPGAATLTVAFEQARDEVAIIGRLGNRIVADIVDRS